MPCGDYVVGSAHRCCEAASRPFGIRHTSADGITALHVRLLVRRTLSGLWDDDLLVGRHARPTDDGHTSERDGSRWMPYRTGVRALDGCQRPSRALVAAGVYGSEIRARAVFDAGVRTHRVGRPVDDRRDISE